MKQCVGYVRCSTEMQEDSPEQQQREIEIFARAKDWEIIEWFVDFGKSGTTFEQRPEFQRLRKQVENKPSFTAVICWDESRWGRAIDSEENTYWRFHFRKHGVDVVLVKTAIDPTNEFAPMMKSFESIQASSFSKKLSRDTLRGALDNRKYSNGGTAPYGYKREAINTQTLQKRDLPDGVWCTPTQEKVGWRLGDPSEIEVVQTIFEMASRGHSWIVIAKHLNDNRIPCAKRGQWRNKNMKWSSGTIRSMIQNPAYYGARRYNRLSMSKIIASQRGRDLNPSTDYPCWKNDESEWIIEPNAHEPIISKEVWDKANQRSSRMISSKPRTESRFILTGLIRCSKCGFPFQGQSSKSKGHHYRRYVCGGYQSKRVCDYCQLDMDEIETFVLKGIQGLIATPQLRELIYSKVNELSQTKDKRRSQGMKSVERQIASLDAKIRNLTKAIEEGVELSLIKPQLDERIAERKLLTAALHELSSVHEETLELVDAQKLVGDFIDSFETRRKILPIHELKHFVRKFVRLIDVQRDENVARVYLRRIPAAHPKIEQIQETIWKTKTDPQNEDRLFKVGVAGVLYFLGAPLILLDSFRAGCP